MKKRLVISTAADATNLALLCLANNNAIAAEQGDHFKGLSPQPSKAHSCGGMQGWVPRLWLLCAAVAWVTPTMATNRNWTGHDSANWSDPNNWSPAGIPQNGDSLNFGFVSDSNRTMDNDIGNLAVSGLYFGNNDYVLNGNSLTLTFLDNTEAADGPSALSYPSETVDINCPLVFVGDSDGDTPAAVTGNSPGRVTQTTLYLHLNGPITVQGNLLLHGISNGSLSGGGNGELYVSGVISGNGDVTAWADDDGSGDVSSVEFNGTPGNNFTGTLWIGTSGKAQITFNKSSGFVATNSVGVSTEEITNWYAGGGITVISIGGAQAASLNFAAPNQLGDFTALDVMAGCTLTLGGNNVTVGSLSLENNSGDANAATLDTGSIEVGLNYGITSSNYSLSVTPIVKGKININGVVNCAMGGPAYSALEMQATLASLGGLSVNGSSALQLEASNAFTGPVIINSGILDLRANGALGQASGVQLNGGGLTLNSIDIPAEPLSVTAPNSVLFANGPCTWEDSITLDDQLTVYAADSLQLAVNGNISGPGGFLFLGQTIGLGGSPNTYTGTTYSLCTLLQLNGGFGGWAVSSEIMSGPLVIGNSSGASCEVRWEDYARLFNFNSGNQLPVTVFPGGLMNLNGFEDIIGGLTFNGGTVEMGANGVLMPGPVLVNPNSTPITIQGGQLDMGPGLGPVTYPSGSGSFDVEPGEGPELTISSSIVGYYGITKTGAGILVLSGNNTFETYNTGANWIYDGLLDATSPTALGYATNETVVEPGATLVAGTTLESGPISIAGNGIDNGTDGALYLTPGTLLGANVILAANASVRTDDGTGYLTGAISGPGGLIKMGTGSLALDGSSPDTFSGPTIVSDGILQVNKASGINALSDSISIGNDGNPATSATLAMDGGVLAPRADVTVHQSGLFDNEVSGTTIHTLSGAGQANLGAPLTLNNDVFCEFQGELSGPGALTKIGAGTFELTGNSPAYTGLASIVSGTYQVEGAISNSPVTVDPGATLLGGGAVGNVDTIGAASLVSVNASLADHYGGSLSVSNLVITNGGTVALNFYGSSKTRSDGQIVAAGSVNLTNAQLSAAFLYPPQAGDSIFAVQKNSSGPINGVFNGFPDGAQVNVGTVPVLATYEGGNGHDFVLIVTNLAMAYDGYRLDGGNGNQTIVPNECVLVYVTLINQSSNTVTLTNTFLRSLTPGAEVIIPQATYPTLSPNTSSENLSPFQLRTDPSLPCLTPVNLQLIVGVPGEGQIGIPFTVVAGSDCTQQTGPCEFPIVTTNQFASNSPIVVQPLLFDGDPSVCYPAKNCPGPDPNLPSYLYEVFNFTNSSSNALCIGALAQFVCTNNAPSNSLGAVAYLGGFDPTQPCAGYLGDNGGSSPPYPTFYFNVPAGAPFSVVVMDRSTNLACSTFTLEMFGLPNEPPTMLSTWTNKAGGDWSVITNWDVHLLPTVTSNASIPELGVIFSVTNDLPVRIYELKYNAVYGTLLGSGVLTLDGPFTWQDGSLGAQSTVFANGGMQIFTGSGYAGKSLSGATLVNSGAAVWNGAGSIELANSAILSNSPAGTFDCTSDGTLDNSAGANLFANAGMFAKTGGTGSTTISVPFSNSGTAEVQTATLSLSGGLSNSGAIVINSGTTLDLGGSGVNSLSTPGSSITGAGDVVFGGTGNYAGTVNVAGSNTFNFGTATFTGPYTCTNNALTINADSTAIFNGTGVIAPATLAMNLYSTLGGSNLVSVSGPTLLGISSALSGSNLVVANGGLTILSGCSISGRTLVNAATGLWTNSEGGAASLGMSFGGVLSNAPGANLEFNGNGDVGFSSGGGAIFNAGTLLKTGAGSTSTLEVPFTNSGLVNIEAGILAISGGGVSSADIPVGSGAGIQFGGGTFTLPPGVTISGPGSFTVSGGTANFAGTVNLGGANTISGGTATFTGPYTCTNNALTIGGGMANFNGTGTIAPATLTVGTYATLGGSNLVIVSGPTLFNPSATLSGSNLVVANGGLTIASGLSLSGRTLVNTAAAFWTNSGAAGINFSGSVFSNAPSGSFVCAIGLANSLSGSGAIINQGYFRKMAPASTTQVEVPFTNNGTVEVDAGTLDVNFNAYAVYVQNGGVTFLNGGNFANNTPLLLLGGVLDGTGLISGALTNAALVSPGPAPGQLIVTGNYSQTAAGALAIALGGTNPITGFDQLVVSNTATLGGALNVTLTNGFYPPTNASFTVLICGSRSNTFSAFNFPSNLVGLALNYTATNATLRVVNTRPIVAPIPNQLILNGALFSYAAQATDSDSPVQTLTYALTNSPVGASINSNGVITWTPNVSPLPLVTNITVLVTDSGTPPLTSSQSFQVTVVNSGFSEITSFHFGVPGAHSNTLNLLGVPGERYLTQYATNLHGPWLSFATNIAGTNGVWMVIDPSATNPMRFYRGAFVQISVNSDFSEITSLLFGVPGLHSNTLTLLGTPGVQYLTQYATDLAGPWFNFATNVAGTNGVWMVVDPAATSRMRFYRARFPAGL